VVKTLALLLDGTNVIISGEHRCTGMFQHDNCLVESLPPQDKVLFLLPSH